MQYIGTIASGNPQTVIWELHCDAVSENTLTVTAVGWDANLPRTDPRAYLEAEGSTDIRQAYLIDLWGPYEVWDDCTGDYIQGDGWNQISLMVRPDDTSIGSVLWGLEDKVLSVWYYDASTEEWGGTWLSATWDGTQWIGDLTTMEDGKGYWIQVTEDCTIALVGDARTLAPPQVGPYVPASYRVYKGWNLVGFSSLMPMPLNEYFFSLYYNDILKKVWWWGSGPWYSWSLLDDVISIECYDYDYYMIDISPSTATSPSYDLPDYWLNPGQGFWIWVADDSEIVVTCTQDMGGPCDLP
jgi:hypothetical protein